MKPETPIQRTEIVTKSNKAAAHTSRGPMHLSQYELRSAKQDALKAIKLLSPNEAHSYLGLTCTKLKIAPNGRLILNECG